MSDSGSPLESPEILELQRQLMKFSNAIAEFEAMGAELQTRRRDARILDMLRLNQETVNAIRRSAELVQERIKHAQLRARPVAFPPAMS
jgi:hypothetical protein